MLLVKLLRNSNFNSPKIRFVLYPDPSDMESAAASPPNHLRSSSVPPTARRSTDLIDTSKAVNHVDPPKPRSSGLNRTPSASASAMLGKTPSSRSTSSTPTDWSALPPPNPNDLLKLQLGVVLRREGSVLGRGCILKGDYYLPERSVRRKREEGLVEVGTSLNLRGAPNFRSGGLGVFGTAQITQTGLRTVLGVLKSQQTKEGGEGRSTVWFS